MNQLTKHITSNIQEQDCGWLKKPVLKGVQSHSYSFTTNASSKIFNKKQQDLVRGTRSLRAHAPKPNSSRKWGGGRLLFGGSTPPENGWGKFLNDTEIRPSNSPTWIDPSLYETCRHLRDPLRSLGSIHHLQPPAPTLKITANSPNSTHVSKHRIPNYTLET